MRKNRLPGEYNLEENIVRSRVASEGEHLVTDALSVEHNKQIKNILKELSAKDETEKWVLFISACGGIGFIPREEAITLNMGPLGETRTIHNVPDADGKVADSMEAYTYEVYG